MKKTHVLALLLAGAIALGGVTYAWMGPAYLTDDEKEEWQDTQERIRQAMEDNDYETWKALMTERFNEMTAQENFEEMQEMHQERAEIRNQIQQALENEDYELAGELKAQVGEGRGFMRRGMGMHSGNCPMQ